MVAGLELIKGMPVDDPRFLIVFTDGEDINSAFKSDVVSLVAQGVPNLRVFVIDYMPGPKIDAFLAGFAGQNHGQARKAGTGADLLTLFKRFASRMDNFYVVSYAFAPVAGPTAKPARAAARLRQRPPRPLRLRHRPLRPPRLRRQPPRPRRLRPRPPPRLRRPRRRAAATGGCGFSC